MVTAIREAEALLAGGGVKAPTPAEIQARLSSSALVSGPIPILESGAAAASALGGVG